MSTDSWSRPNVVDFFSKERQTAADLYPSEAQMLASEFKENLSILDIGCAQGGFAQIFSQKLKQFSYTGVDQSRAMIEKAKSHYPQHKFVQGDFCDMKELSGFSFDLVICFGVLHLTFDWQKILTAAWASTKGKFIFDLRESGQPTVANKNISYFKMNWNTETQIDNVSERLPYIVVNSSAAMAAIEESCPSAKQVEQYGYFHEPRGSAVTPFKKVITKCYKLTKEDSP